MKKIQKLPKREFSLLASGMDRGREETMLERQHITGGFQFGAIVPTQVVGTHCEYRSRSSETLTRRNRRGAPP